MCCKWACIFKLWASQMSEEQLFQIKSLKEDHQYSRNFKLGSIMNYKLLSSHYNKDMLHRKKTNNQTAQSEIIQKFGFKVSLCQYKRVRKHATTIIKGTPIEHYSKLWSYIEDIRRSNPVSTVKMVVVSMLDRSTYFSKFYACLGGAKKVNLVGCRRKLGLMHVS